MLTKSTIHEARSRKLLFTDPRRTPRVQRVLRVESTCVGRKDLTGLGRFLRPERQERVGWGDPFTRQVSGVRALHKGLVESNGVCGEPDDAQGFRSVRGPPERCLSK